MIDTMMVGGMGAVAFPPPAAAPVVEEEGDGIAESKASESASGTYTFAWRPVFTVYFSTLETTQRQMEGFFSPTPIQMLPPGGSICGRLT